MQKKNDGTKKKRKNNDYDNDDYSDSDNVSYYYEVSEE